MTYLSSTWCIILLICVNNIFKCSSNAELSPDSKRLYHDIVSGNGLYHGFTKLAELGSNNFKSTVFGDEKHKLWLVEFYNSWCGHCHRFAPTWKTLASDIYGWGDEVGIGAVDCANDDNNQLCRDMEVMYYPMIKLFPPHSDDKFLGEDFSKGTVEEMRKALVVKLKAYQAGQERVEGGVRLKSLQDTSLGTVWGEATAAVKFLILVAEPEDSEVGSELALDLSRTKEVKVRLIHPTNENLSEVVGLEPGTTGAVLIDRELKRTDIQIKNYTRMGLNNAVRQVLVSRGVDVSLELPVTDPDVEPEVDITEVMNVMQMEEDIKKKLNTDDLSTSVFQPDLDGTILYSLNNEVPLHKNITGERLTALHDYLTVLIKYFPFVRKGVNFLKKLKKVALGDKHEVSGHTFREVVRQLEEEFKPFLPNQGFIGCRGSQPGFRGYPCGLWTLFHTLTVHEEARDRGVSGEGPEVTFVMARYIKEFFTCSDCSDHFKAMAKTMHGNITTQDESIMWLWAAHNKVNHRLAGDATEDPKHVKIQFPSPKSCPPCRVSDGTWNETAVLRFMKKMYSNVLYMGEKDLVPITTTTAAPSHAPVSYDKSLRNELYNDERGFYNKPLVDSKRSIWDFNVFDISLCVVLYVCSVAILILVCIKFIFKRSYRKKPYIHDILSKV